MQLIKLVAKNFKKLSDFTANFSDGLNVIVGENAQGKSTLLQAVEAALFGVTVVPGKKENIPTWGQTNFSLELQFEVDGARYVLTRSKSTAKLVERASGGDALVANGNTPVTAFIEELLGLTAKDFNLFVQSKQGETSGVLTFGATALNQKVEEYAGVSLIDAVGKRANELATEQRAIAAANEVDPAELAAGREEAQLAGERLAAAEAAEATAQATWDSLPTLEAKLPEVSAQRLTEQRREADKLATYLSEAKNDVTLKTQAVAAAEEAMAAVGEPVDIDALTKRKNEASACVRDLRSRRSDLSSELSAAQQAQQAVSDAQAERLTARQEYSLEVLDNARQAFALAAEATKTAGEQMAVLSARLRDMRSLQEGAVCPTCNSTLTEHDPVALAAEVADLEAQLASQTENEREAKAQASAQQKVITRQEAAAVKLEQVEQRLQRAQEAASKVRPGIAEELQEANQRLEEAEAELAQIKANLDAAEETNELHSATRRKLSRAETALEEAEDLVTDREELLAKLHRPTDVEIDSAAQAEAAYRDAEREHERLKSLANSTLVLAKAETRSARASADHAAAELKRLEDSAARGQAARELLDRASRLSRFLRDRRQSYLQEIWHAVMGAASRQVATASRGQISRISNEGGEFTFEEDGVLAPVASASGAQKAFIGSAVRIGLARALYGSDSLLIFDEPTESMSERNASGLAASLTGAARQLLLITHREQDQGLAANIIQVGA